MNFFYNPIYDSVVPLTCTTGLANWYVIRNYKCLFMLVSLSSDLITTTNTKIMKENALINNLSSLLQKQLLRTSSKIKKTVLYFVLKSVWVIKYDFCFSIIIMYFTVRFLIIKHQITSIILPINIVQVYN